MKKAIWLGVVFCSLLSSAQDTVSKNLDEILIYSNKFPEKRKHLVQKIDVISAMQIAKANAQNTGDLLMQTGNIFVQKSQQGGSSPVLRGFEASRVLLVVDGIRMNNAIYRAGHLQNVITVDQNMLERVEVLYGPASTLFGSDALGGVLHFSSKQPKLSTNETLLATGSVFGRYSSANHEKTLHSDVSIGGKKFAWLQSYNYSDFDDMKMGAHYPGKYASFGSRPGYIGRINGIDSVIFTADSNVQRFSGYQQWDITEKFLYRPNEKASHLVNLQYSNSTSVPRYDRLQDIKNFGPPRGTTLRYAEWYYGPQLRQLAAYHLNVNRLAFLDELKAVASYQHIEESRHQREYRSANLDHRLEDLNVFGFTIDGRKIRGNNELTLGMDGQLNEVTSKGVRKNINTGAETILDSRYPNGENNMNYFGIYAQHLLKFGSGKWILNDGIRVQSVHLKSTIADNSAFNLPFTTIEQNNTAVTGNLGLVYFVNKNAKLNGGFSTGFRAPNIDDLARIFESSTANRRLIVPNPDIEPEYTYNFDLNYVQSFGDRLRLEAGGFYTLFRNAIAVAPFQLNGEDSVLYNGTVCAVFANQNVNKAYLYGFNASINFEIGSGLNLYSTASYNYGRQQPATGGEVPLDHIPPFFGKTSLAYTFKIFSVDFFAMYNGWKKIGDYNPFGEDNAQYATADGMPSWMTINLRTSVKLFKLLELQAGVENLLDRNYRHFASGFSAPGRNFIVALRSNF